MAGNNDKVPFGFKKLNPVNPEELLSFSDVIDAMSNTGFQGKKFAQAMQTIEEMIRHDNLTIFLTYAGSLSTTGQWPIIKWFLKNNYVDVLVATGANLTEDIINAMGYDYYQDVNKVDDSVLGRSGINRYLDVGGKESDYEQMTEMIGDFFRQLRPNRPDGGVEYATHELLHLFGKWLLKQKRIDGKKGIESIVAEAARQNIPVFCPAITDSPYGDGGIAACRDGKKIVIDAMKEYEHFVRMGTMLEGRDTGVVYIGGGVPKDFTQLFAVTGSMMFDEKKVPGRKGQRDRQGSGEEYYPHKYAVQITMALEQDGGLSGCTIDEETISWGKESPDGKNYACFCDATIFLPIASYYLKETLNGFQRKKTDLTAVFDDIRREQEQIARS